MSDSLTRRGWFAGAASLLVAAKANAMPEKPAFGYCLNTSTVRDNGKPRPLEQLIDIAAKAGYTAIEPWVAEIDAYVRIGNTLKDLKKRISDAGLAVPSAIGFAEWIVEDEPRRRKGLETAKRDMDWVAQLGGQKIAAPPIGATRTDDVKDGAIDLLVAADRYRDLLELGQSMGVIPQIEIWGFSKSLKRLGEAWLVACECGKAGGCILPDVYHLYRGGSDFLGLNLLAPAAIGIFHVNDYPKIDRNRITDADRVYPGDGVAPLGTVFKALQTISYSGYLSVELFNKGYWKQDPNLVARTALEKLKKAVEN